MTLSAIDGRALLLALAASIALLVWARSVLSQANRERDTTTSLLAPPKATPKPPPPPKWHHLHFHCQVCRTHCCMQTTSLDVAMRVLDTGNCPACALVLDGLERQLP